MPAGPAAKTALRILGRRVLALDEEKARIDALPTGLVTKTAPRLLEVDGGGHRHRGRVHQSGHRRSRRRRFPYARRRAGAARPGGRDPRAGRLGLRAAFHGLRTSPLSLTQTAAVTTMAAIITALAEHTAD